MAARKTTKKMVELIFKRWQFVQDLDYSRPDILGLANTWPQQACALPGPMSNFDWEGDVPLELPMEDLVIYEMHVRGFTWDQSSRTRCPGKYQMIFKISGLKPYGYLGRNICALSSQILNCEEFISWGRAIVQKIRSQKNGKRVLHQRNCLNPNLSKSLNSFPCTRVGPGLLPKKSKVTLFWEKRSLSWHSQSMWHCFRRLNTRTLIPFLRNWTNISSVFCCLLMNKPDQRQFFCWLHTLNLHWTRLLSVALMWYNCIQAHTVGLWRSWIISRNLVSMQLSFCPYMSLMN